MALPLSTTGSTVSVGNPRSFMPLLAVQALQDREQAEGTWRKDMSSRELIWEPNIYKYRQLLVIQEHLYQCEHSWRAHWLFTLNASSGAQGAWCAGSTAPAGVVRATCEDKRRCLALVTFGDLLHQSQSPSPCTNEWGLGLPDCLVLSWNTKIWSYFVFSSPSMTLKQKRRTLRKYPHTIYIKKNYCNTWGHTEITHVPRYHPASASDYRFCYLFLHWGYMLSKLSRKFVMRADVPLVKRWAYLNAFQGLSSLFSEFTHGLTNPFVQSQLQLYLS